MAEKKKASRGTRLYYAPRIPVAEQSDEQKLYYEFIQSIYRGDSEAFDGLLDRIQDVNKNELANSKSGTHWTPLMHAVHKDRIKFVKKLLERGANVEVMDNKNQRSLLHNATEHGYTEMCELLLRHNLDINTIDVDGESPIWTACRKGYSDIVELLLNQDLSQQICDINLKKPSNGQSPIFVASDRGYLPIVKALLGYENMKCNVDETDLHSRTPLMRACIKSHSEVVKLLLQNGANPNIRNDVLRNCLMVSFKLNKPKICKILLNNDYYTNGIEMWLPDINDKYILQYETAKSDKKIAKQIQKILHTVLQSAIQDILKDVPESVVTYICYMTYYRRHS